MRPLIYLSSCAAILAATIGARLALRPFIPAPTDDPSTLTHCMHRWHDDDGTGHPRQADCVDPWPITITTDRSN